MSAIWLGHRPMIGRWNAREYLFWTEKVVAELRGTNPALEDYYNQELISGKTLLGMD